MIYRFEIYLKGLYMLIFFPIKSIKLLGLDYELIKEMKK